jgi:Domain of unknown function (DUF3425)
MDVYGRGSGGRPSALCTPPEMPNRAVTSLNTASPNDDNDNDNDDGDNGPQKQRDRDRDRRRSVKRVQNRLSQQCHRENRTSYIRQLERFVEAIQCCSVARTDGSPDERDPQVVLRLMHKKELQLVRENQKLRDAALRVRRKMLRLSVEAEGAAEDGMVRKILDGTEGAEEEKDDDDKQKQKQQPVALSTSPSTPLLAAATTALAPAIASVAPNLPSSLLPPGITPIAPIPIATPPALGGPSMMIGGLSPAAAGELDMMKGMGWVEGSGELVPTAEGLPLAATGDVAGPSGLDWSPGPYQTGTGFFTFDGPLSPYASSLSARPPLAPTPTLSIYSDTIVSAIEATVLSLFDGLRFSPLKEAFQSSSMYLYPYSFSPQEIASIDRKTLSDVCSTVFRLLLKSSSSEDFTYAAGTPRIHQKILRWRLSPTPANFAAIPEPFRPTALQQVTHTRPAFVDLVLWPSLRDQLIVNMGMYDTGEMMRDIMEQTVREIPSLRIAIPIMDVWRGLQQEETNTPHTKVEEDEDDYFDKDKPPIPYREDALRRARMYGLHQLEGRKLARGFGRKWGWLDVRSC